MTLTHLVRTLRENGIQLWVEDGQLRYRAPPGRLTAELTAAIRERKPEIVAILGSANPEVTPGPRLVRRSQEGLLPLSLIQEDFASYYSGLVYPRYLHVISALNIKGALHLALLRQAVSELRHRHSVLRMRIARDDAGRNWAVIQPDAELPVQCFQCDDESDIRAQIEPFACKHFDIEAGPLMRVGVFSCATDSQSMVVVLVFHHLVMDGYSLSLATEELLMLYDAAARGVSPGLPEPTLQFSDYAAYQREWLETQEARQMADYWSRRCAGAVAPFALPRNRTTPIPGPIRPFPTGNEITDEGVRRLRQVGQAQGVALSTVVLAAFAAAVSRWTRGSDIFCWVCHLGRSAPELRNIIGCLFDGWVMRLDLSGDPPFSAIVRAVESAYHEALPNLALPGGAMAAELMKAAGGGSEFPAILCNYNIVAESAPDLETQPITVYDQLPYNAYLEPAGHMALNMGIFEKSDSVSWTFLFDPRLFEDDTVQALSQLLLDILQRVGKEPQIPLSRLPTL